MLYNVWLWKPLNIPPRSSRSSTCCSRRCGIHVPDHMVFVGLITLFILFIGLAIRSSLSVENPGKLQIILEDIVSFLVGVLEDNMGPKGRKFLPLLGTIFVFILIGNLMGQIPGLGSPTSNINVPFALRADAVALLSLAGHHRERPVQLHQALRGDAGRADRSWRR